MKLLVIFLFILSFLNADEIKRMDSVVEDISKLKADYQKCQDSLNGKISNDISADTTSEEQRRSAYKKYKCDADQLIALEEYTEEIEKYKKLVALKDKEIEDLKNKFNSKTCKHTKVIKIFDNPNKFPPLISKREQDNEIKAKTVTIKPQTYVIKYESIIYDYPRGTNIGKWDVGTTFTSNKKFDYWIKVTGYFVNGKWKKADQELWIKEAQVEVKK